MSNNSTRLWLAETAPGLIKEKKDLGFLLPRHLITAFRSTGPRGLWRFCCLKAGRTCGHGCWIGMTADSAKPGYGPGLTNLISIGKADGHGGINWLYSLDPAVLAQYPTCEKASADQMADTINTYAISHLKHAHKVPDPREQLRRLGLSTVRTVAEGGAVNEQEGGKGASSKMAEVGLDESISAILPHRDAVVQVSEDGKYLGGGGDVEEDRGEAETGGGAATEPAAARAARLQAESPLLFELMSGMKGGLAEGWGLHNSIARDIAPRMLLLRHLGLPQQDVDALTAAYTCLRAVEARIDYTLACSGHNPSFHITCLAAAVLAERQLIEQLGGVLEAIEAARLSDCEPVGMGIIICEPVCCRAAS